MTPMSNQDLLGIVYAVREKSQLSFKLEFGPSEMRRHLNHHSRQLASPKRIELALALYRLATLKLPSPLEIRLASALFGSGQLATSSLFADNHRYSLESQDDQWQLTIWLRHQPNPALNERNIALWTMTSGVKQRLDEIVVNLNQIHPLKECLAELEAQIDQQSSAA